MAKGSDGVAGERRGEGVTACGDGVGRREATSGDGGGRGVCYVEGRRVGGYVGDDWEGEGERSRDGIESLYASVGVNRSVLLPDG